MKKLIYVLVSAGLLIASCGAPKLASYASKKDLTSKAKYDFNKGKIRDNWRGFAVDMAKLGKLPARVALVTFYIDDPGLTKTSGTNSSGKTFTTTNTGSANAKIFATDFYSKSIETLKSGFAKYGMTVLTPSEFLTDDDKKQAYNDFIVKHTKMNELGQKLMKGLKNMGNYGTTLEMDESAEGFKLIKVNNRDFADAKKKTVPVTNLNGSIDGQMIESMGYDLAKSLDVDAVLVIYNSQLCDKKWGKDRYWLSAVNMQMFGPNPLPLKEGKKDNNAYNKGLFYCGVRMPFKKGLLINPKIKDEALRAPMEKANTEAYNNMIAGCANKMGLYFQKELKK